MSFDMKICLVQFNPTVGHLKANTEKIKEFIRRVRGDGADLIVFPELALTGYPPGDLLLYKAFLEQTEKTVLEEILPLTEGITVFLGTPWLDAGEGCLFDAALVLSGGKIISKQYKTFLSDTDVFDESRYFTPAAESGYITAGGLKIAVTIGEEVLFDSWGGHSRRGIDLLLNISASPYHLGKARDRRQKLCGLAGKYHIPLVYVNQIGGNDELIFDGSCTVCSDRGKIVYQAPPFREGCFFYDTDSGDVGPFETDDTAPPVVEVRDYEQTEDINWVYAALLRGLADYMGKTGFSKVVFGLSGGIDSAVIAALAVAVLGPEQALGVMMPSRYSSDHSVADSRKLAENLGIETLFIPIEKPFRQYMECLNDNGEPLMDLAEENLQARIRGNILMFISNRQNRMLLTTGNKSELAVGYCTLYGDMCGGLAVLADLPKQMVYRLAEYINAKAGKELIPQAIIDKPPSAELRPDQLDQDSLPPYEVLDKILHYYVEDNKHIDEIAALGYERELVGNIVYKIDRSEYKRFQAAPVLRITSRAFGRGRRLPLARGYLN